MQGKQQLLIKEEASDYVRLSTNAMEDRDSNYYEANAADVNLEEITSSAENANTLQRLRDGDPTLNFFYLNLGRDDAEWGNFHVREGDDMGWVGYFIGKSEYLLGLHIHYLPDGEEAHAFLEGIARSQSIRHIGIMYLSNYGFTSTVRVLHSLSQLEGLSIHENNNVGPDGWSELRTLLESGVCKLKQPSLHLCGNSEFLSNRLRGIGPSLKNLVLSFNSIGNEGLLALVAGLTNCNSLEKLNLSWNDFSLATAGLRSLSDWLWRDEVNLKRLELWNCRINDEGLRALSQGAANHCEDLYLGGNESITTTGLSYLFNSIRSDSCRVETLNLLWIPIGSDVLEVLARGLAGNKSVRSLYLDALDDDVTVDGWAAFSTTMCDTSNVNSTYLSNHTICNFRLVGGDGEIISLPQDISLYLGLNEQHPQYAAECKILMSHRHLDMTPFLQWKWKLKFLPLAAAWFERAKLCTSLTIYEANSASMRRVLDESNDALQSRALSAMYEFVRGMPMEVMKSREVLIVMAYDDKIAMAEEEINRLVNKKKGLLKDKDSFLKDVEQRDDKRLSQIVANVAFAVFLFLAVVESLRSSSLDL